MKTGVLVIIAALVFSACTTPASSSPTPPATPTSTTVPTSSATASPAPTVIRGSALVPPIVSRAQYGDMAISLDVPNRPGQPAEAVVWHVDPFKAPAGYAARVASVLGLTGAGVVGEAAVAATGQSGPWRLWFGDRVLAVNETSGELLYFDPKATDGAPPAGPARRDPAEIFRVLLNQLGWTADLVPDLGGPMSFHGTEVAARAEHVINGSWLSAGYRETAVLFPRYPSPASPNQPGPHVYSADHLALLTAAGRPAEIIHRPLGKITGGEVYPITTLGQARSELLASPLRYLHYLSNPTGEPLKLTVGDAHEGSVWGGFSAEGLTRNGQMLIPAYVFPATGTTASGIPVEAIFIVDAVIPALRAQGLGGTSNTNADTLLRYQLDTLGGQNMELLTARGAARFFLGTACDITTATQEMSASGTMNCGPASTISFTMRRAFPGLGASSVWYLAESHK